MIPWHPSTYVVKNQQSIWAVYKPCGILSQPNKTGGCEHSILRAHYDTAREAYITNEGPIYLINRLDSPTSGLVILCTDLKIAQEVRKCFKAHKVEKHYQAIVKGRFPANVLWEDLIRCEHKEQYLRSRLVQSGGVKAKTKGSLIKHLTYRGEAFSLIRLYPLTGKTHQLRVQCAQHHFPILGDKTYGNFDCNKRLKAKRLYLQAIHIQMSIGGTEFVADCSPDFTDINEEAPVKTLPQL